MFGKPFYPLNLLKHGTKSLRSTWISLDQFRLAATSWLVDVGWQGDLMEDHWNPTEYDICHVGYRSWVLGILSKWWFPCSWNFNGISMVFYCFSVKKTSAEALCHSIHIVYDGTL